MKSPVLLGSSVTSFNVTGGGIWIIGQSAITSAALARDKRDSRACQMLPA
jgi:hypothetical protein